MKGLLKKPPVFHFKSIFFHSIMLFFLFPFVYGKLYGQHVSLAGGINISFRSINLTAGGGLNFSGELRFLNNYAVKLNAGFELGEFSYSCFGGDSYSLASYEGTFLFYPFSTAGIQPFCGIGAGYYCPTTKRDGNAKILPDDLGEHTYYLHANQLDNNAGYNLLTGIKFNANSPFSLGLELKYIFLRTQWKSYISGNFDYFTIQDKIDLSHFTGRISFNFRL